MLRKFISEFFGTFFLLMAIVGSGIMGQQLAAGNQALILLANSIVTAAALYVLISMWAGLSGAHFNPCVTLIKYLRKEITLKDLVFYLPAQFLGAILGVFLSHFIFELPVIQASQHIRSGFALYVSEALATFFLLLIILMTRKNTLPQIAGMIALYILAAYWFTSSTSFANPAVTLARSFTDTFSGISILSVPKFILSQIIGALSAYFFFSLFLEEKGNKQ